ncbi:hypothetical protein FHS89_001503 [Rubricella aquisinus]|uniref:Twin-arginine translocation pathway signal protein n=1 Tax=Rubricella aquisinus TaxID=2028108 RepID=A0A840WLS0_9RHOB|nr:twin-arginine translocation pathway signal protein [Rubricella aquisinus]MBB5515491.1 hypothetical protein [Rubricella aquisinus]
MPVSRRSFLSVLGGGVILAAGGGALFATTRTPTKALAPWAEAGQYADARTFALSHAILAPNPHNLQPWMVSLDGADQVTLYRDPTRALPHTDPYDRQITIGLGCFLEQMRIAATARGIRTETNLVLEGDVVARVTFYDEGIATDPLFAAIPHRRTTKEPFDMAQPVAAADIPRLNPDIAGIRFDGTADSAKVAELRDIAWQAWLIEYETPHTLQESIDVMRLGKAEIEANPDGIDLGGPFLEGLMVAGMLTRDDLGTPGTQSYQAGYDIYQPLFTATPAFVWITSPGNSRTDQIAAGAAWLRLNLGTTAAGMALHPVSQALQEYPEMTAQYDRIHGLLARDGETVQMLGRLGYAAPVPQTPRWSLDAKLRSSV